MRVELYSGLHDAISKAKADKSGQTEEAKIGQMIVLPSSYTGSPRWMYSHYLDALAIARKYRKLTQFITMATQISKECQIIFLRDRSRTTGLTLLTGFSIE